MIYFVGAGPGDADLITVKGQKILQKADAVLYTGSLIPHELLKWVPRAAKVQSSENMNYNDIVSFLARHSQSICVRLHTGDPSLYSTIAKQIDFLQKKNIDFEVVPGVTAAFAAAAAMKIEYTLPSVSQGVLLTRLDGNTPNPENLENILSLKHTSLVFYLSAKLSSQLVATARKLQISLDTAAAVCYKVSWRQEKIFKTTLKEIPNIFMQEKIKGTALILLGDFLRQEDISESHLYSKNYKQKRKQDDPKKF